jgi:putative heme-binding domain-containing protein
LAEPAAIQQSQKLLENRKGLASAKIAILKTISESKLEDLREVVLDLVLADGEAEPVRIAAARALSAFDGTVGSRVLQDWNQLPAAVGQAAAVALATRESWCWEWFQRCDQMRVDPKSLPVEALTVMRSHLNQDLQRAITKTYPQSPAIDLRTALEKSNSLKAIILAANGNPYEGKKLYRNSCAKCHQLFDDPFVARLGSAAGKLGPDLTSYQRDQLDALLLNIVAPSLEIREGFRVESILMEDGTIVTGFRREATEDQVHLQTIDDKWRSIARDQISEVRVQPQSLMPDGLLDSLSDQELRDLFAYLRSSQPLNDGS